MKSKINRIILFPIVLLVCTSTLFITCEDYTGKYEMTGGTPTIHFIKVANIAGKDSLLVGAFMGETICIVGDNLTSVQEIFFNNIKAILNINYITKNTLFVTVPSTLPEETTNKMYLINKAGVTTEYDFIVRLPSPSIRAIKCEHVPEGGKVVLLGDFFLDYPEAPIAVNVGSYAVPYTDIVDIQKTTLTFKAPPENITGQITVRSTYGTSAKSKQYFRDMRGWITGFEEDFVAGWGRPVRIENEPELSLMGRYVRFQGNLDPGDNPAYVGGYDAMIINIWSQDNSSMSDPLFSGDPKTSILRFEVNVLEAWSAGPIIAMFDGAGTNESMWWADGTQPRGFWVPWLETGSYKGDGWETVSIPLSEMKFSGNGTDVGVSSTFGELGIGIHNRGMAAYGGTACSPVILIDNVRVVPGD